MPLLNTVFAGQKETYLAVGACVMLWLGTVRLLRYHTRDSKHAKFGYKTKESFKNMSVQDAWDIQRYILATEFPWIGEKALQFALFRTYGIPTISSLLVETNQFSKKENAGRRYTDTEVLISEFTSHAPDSDRAISSIARMNFLHGVHQKRGKISNDDLLYTLSLFAMEPIRWINKYEWRTVTDMEICAIGTFWKHLGDSMQISYEGLSGNIEDGYSWWKAIEIWSLEYEKRCMVPDVTNYITAEETVALLLYNIPSFMVPVGRPVVWALMDERLRRAMMYPDPPQWLSWAIDKSLKLRGLLIRYLFLPRPWAFRKVKVSEKESESGTFHMMEYVAEPWYIQSSFLSLWGPLAILRRFAGKPVPGPEFQDKGYIIREVGPRSYRKLGQKEQVTEEARLKAMDRVGCPFK